MFYSCKVRVSVYCFLGSAQVLLPRSLIGMCAVSLDARVSVSVCLRALSACVDSWEIRLCTCSVSWVATGCPCAVPGRPGSVLEIRM